MNHQFIHSLHSNFTIISSRLAILHSLIELLCIFHVNCCLLFISWWCEKEDIPLLCSLSLSKGSSLNAMQSLPVGRSHSWQLNAHQFLYPQQTVVVMKQLEVSHHTTKEQDCALWSVQVLHLSLCTDDIESEMTILLCVMQIIQFCKKHMHCTGRIVSKYSFLKTVASTICAWCFCEKLKTWWNSNYIVMRELCVCNECIVKCAFKDTFMRKHRGEVKVIWDGCIWYYNWYFFWVIHFHHLCDRWWR